MKTAPIFKCGNSWAVRLPKEFHLRGSRVEILKHGNMIILREIPENLAKAFQVLTQLPDDFFADDREDTPPQERDF